MFLDESSILLLEYVFYLTSSEIVHKRKIYDLVALLGDLGGVTEVLMLGMGCLLFPIAESSYNMMSTKRMFIARTANNKLFDEVSEDKKKKWFLSDTCLPDGMED